jgi:hypothetical protein
VHLLLHILPTRKLIPQSERTGREVSFPRESASYAMCVAVGSRLGSCCMKQTTDERTIIIQLTPIDQPAHYNLNPTYKTASIYFCCTSSKIRRRGQPPSDFCCTSAKIRNGGIHGFRTKRKPFSSIARDYIRDGGSYIGVSRSDRRLRLVRRWAGQEGEDAFELLPLTS